MKLKCLALVFALAIVALSAVARAADPPSAQFQIQQATIAPGTVLPPGAYSIRVVDHLRDRFLVRVEGSRGASRSTFIAVPSKTISGHPGAVTWTAATNGQAALRGFVFQGGHSAVEFVYPKDQAVSLAKANGTGVLAVDPASEGKSAELAQLSPEDMQIVTLWTLTPERVSPQASEVTISAARYSQAGQPAPNRPAPLKRLPHTASELPLVIVAGLIAAFSAFLLMLRRKLSRATGAAA